MRLNFWRGLAWTLALALTAGAIFVLGVIAFNVPHWIFGD